MQSEESLDVENTLWANCVVASGTALGLVVYTGAETRSVMNNSQPRSKVGQLDMEVNQITKVLINIISSFLSRFLTFCGPGSILRCDRSVSSHDLPERIQRTLV